MFPDCQLSATVKFVNDGVTYNCHLSDIRDRKVLHVSDKRLVKWKDGHFYSATITHIGK